jgi:uncharacterized lipoprotein NlpE involved in copper resistance
MNKTLFLPILAALFLAACGTKGTADTSSAAADAATQGADTLMADKAHSSQNALDWAGMYKGVVPCADCEGIETVLILNSDNTYLLRTNYLGKPDAQAIEKTGSFTWNPAGNTVILGNIENAPTQYFVGENQVIQLDMSGNRITGGLADKYILAKQ